MTTATTAVEDVTPPRATQGGRAARAGLMRATALACMVRDEGADSIGDYLDPLTRDQLYATIVALAALVDPDDVVEDRLAWVTEQGQQLERDLARASMARRRAAQEAAA